MLSEAETNARLRAFEDEVGAFAFLVDGISAWRLIRFPVALALQGIALSAPRLDRRTLLAHAWYSLRDIFHYRGGYTYAVKSYVSAQRFLGESGAEDIYFNSLLREVPGGVYFYTLNTATGDPSPWLDRVTAVNTTGIQVLAAILARIFPCRDGVVACTQLAYLIETRLGVTSFSTARILRMASSLHWQARLYGWLLRRLGVKWVLAADTGERSLLMACRTLGLKFVELQHGIYTSDHPDAISAATPLRGGARSTLLLPDRLALYGEYWAIRQAGTLAACEGGVVPVGAAVVDWARSLRATRLQDKRPPRLVVTAQGFDQGKLASFLADFLAAYEGDCDLIVKLHPVYSGNGQEYIELVRKDVRVRVQAGIDQPNTYQLIAEADLHLSISSACHFDALAIGTPTGVICLDGWQLVSNLVTENHAWGFSDPIELVTVVQRRCWQPIGAMTSEHYCQSNFVANVSELLNTH